MGNYAIYLDSFDIKSIINDLSLILSLCPDSYISFDEDSVYVVCVSNIYKKYELGMIFWFHNTIKHDIEKCKKEFNRIKTVKRYSKILPMIEKLFNNNPVC